VNRDLRGRELAAYYTALVADASAMAHPATFRHLGVDGEALAAARDPPRFGIRDAGSISGVWSIDPQLCCEIPTKVAQTECSGWSVCGAQARERESRRREQAREEVWAWRGSGFDGRGRRHRSHAAVSRAHAGAAERGRCCHYTSLRRKKYTLKL
jgi:hypothetical protein